MKNDNNIIDIEILYNYLPEGDYIVQVDENSFDENIFEHLKLKNKCNFIEILITSNNPKEPYAIQGDVIFINKKTLEIIYTNNSVVKLCKDVTLLKTNIGDLFENFNSSIKYIERTWNMEFTILYNFQ